MIRYNIISKARKSSKPDHNFVDSNFPSTAPKSDPNAITPKTSKATLSISSLKSRVPLDPHLATTVSKTRSHALGTCLRCIGANAGCNIFLCFCKSNWGIPYVMIQKADKPIHNSIRQPTNIRGNQTLEIILNHCGFV